MADAATNAKGGGMEVISLDDEDKDEDKDEIVDDVDAGDDNGNDGGIGVPTPNRGPVGGGTAPAADAGGRTTEGGGSGGPPPCRPPEPQPGTPWPAPSGGCPPVTKTGGSAMPC